MPVNASLVGWVERVFAIPIIGVEMLDGYRKKRSTHPTALISFAKFTKKYSRALLNQIAIYFPSDEECP
jgi:hypothetical protein